MLKSLLNFPYNFFIIPAIILYVAIKGGKYVKQGIGPWYKELKKPPRTPSGRLIGEIWTFLYTLTGLAVLWYWNVSYPGWFKLATGPVLLINAYYNLNWNKHFFVERHIEKSLLTFKYLLISGVVALILITIHSPIAAFLFLPYLIWLWYARFLTKEIKRLNGNIND